MGEHINSTSVLVIDDDEHLLNSAKEHLENVYGIHVDTSSAFLEGIKKAVRYEYDAIVSDIEIPGTDVIGLMKEKRANGFYTPFIAAYSSIMGSEILKEASDSIADFYLYKGSDTALMYNELHRYITKSVELAKVRKDIFKSETIFPVIWDSIPNGIMIAGRDFNTIITANSAALEIFGVEKTEKLKYYDLSLDPNITPDILRAVKDRSQESFEIEYDFDKIGDINLFKTKRAGKIDLEIKFSPIIKDGSNIGTMIYLTEITEKKDYERQLSNANKKLSLLSGITRHDVLNQIAAARLYTEILSEHLKDDEQASGYLKPIDLCMEKMERQINFSRDYEDLGTYLPVWQNLENIINLGASEALGDGIRLVTNLGSYEVYADQMLIMVFFNLIDNSIRHGRIVTDIVISFYDVGDEGVIVFEDNGIGVLYEDKENIFQKGFGSNTGYGLFLIREILDFKGFHIKETGIPGKGARFEIHVPAGKWRLV